MKSLKYLFSILFVLISFQTVCAENSFIFSTGPQSIPVGQISGKINVQSQSPVTETTYLVFTSSSVTGQFLNSSGNPLTSAYISSGDSNRAVYYKDSTAGDFIISANILSKNKTKITTISQHIFVGQNIPNNVSIKSVSTTTERIQTKANIDNIASEINKVSDSLNKISPQVKVITSQNKIADKKEEIVGNSTVTSSEKTNIDDKIETSNVATVYEAPKSRGLIGTIFAWPIKWFGFISGLFIDK